jgi:transducin (beta)-like 1
MCSITSDEVNSLVYLYLKECGFTHAAFTFEHECSLKRQKLATRMTTTGVEEQPFPPGLLVSYLQRGLLFSQVERHVSDDGLEILDCQMPFSLLGIHECEGKRNKAIDMSILPSPAAMTARRREQREAALQKNRSASPLPTTTKSPGINSFTNSQTVKIKKEMDSRKLGTPPPTDHLMDEDISKIIASPLRSHLAEWIPSEVLLLQGHASEVYCCRWRKLLIVTTPDKDESNHPPSLEQDTSTRLLATGSVDGTLRLWDFHGKTSHSCQSVEMEINDPRNSEKLVGVTLLDWNMKGDRLAIGLHDGHVKIMSSSGEHLRTLDMGQTPVLTVKWSPSGKLLAAISSDIGLVIWDTFTWEACVNWCLRSSSSSNPNSSVNDPNILLTDFDWWPVSESSMVGALSGTHGKLGICHYSKSTKVFHDLVGHTDDVNCVRWDSTGSLLASCSDDSTIRLWSLEIQHATEATMDHPSFQLTGLIAIPIGGSIYCLDWMGRPFRDTATVPTWLALGTMEGLVKVCQIRKDTESGSPVVDSIFTCEAHESSVLSLAFDHPFPRIPDSPSTRSSSSQYQTRYLATVSSDHCLYVWQLPDITAVYPMSPSPMQLQPIRRFLAKDCLYDVDWNGHDLAAASSDGSVYLMDTKCLSTYPT